MTKQKKVIAALVVLVVAMFFLAYALVPLYNLMCDTLGINGKTNATADKGATKPDMSRTITVIFTASRNENLPWKFKPNVKKIEIHPGTKKEISYYAKNLTNHIMTVQAIPSVTPGLAAKHLKKTECFCFEKQTLKSGEATNMPMVFYLDNTLPKNIHEITLHYTLFESIK